MRAEPTLKRGLSLPLITLYGLGTTIGAGIFVLVGRVVGVAGLHAPLAFLVAALLAAFTAFSFAELSARLPQSAGEAVYVQHGLGRRWLSVVVGLLVTAAGVISAATIARGAIGYIAEFVTLPGWLTIIVLVLALGVTAAWGIMESVTVAALLTLIEVGALLAVIAGGADSLAAVPDRLPELLPPVAPGAWLGIGAGAVLAFYAFIGFEDMVNVAEEVKDVTRVLPTAIVLTLVGTTGLYLALSLVAVLAVPADDLAASGAPMALLFETTTGASSAVISLISIFAVLNGALVQIIMAARVLYGLAAQGWLPPLLGRVDQRTRTPLNATGLVVVLVLVLALALPLTTLAEVTAFCVLIVFALVNLALLRIKRREPLPLGIRAVPLWVPAAGFAVSALFVAFQAGRFLGLWAV
jgi:amino acid transporter